MPAICAKCAAPLPDSAYSFTCARCGASIFDTSAPAPGASKLPIRSDLEGIGGWLIFFAIGLIVAPFLFARGIYIDLSLLNSSQFSQILADHPGAARILVTEICAYAFFLAAVVVLNYFFYRKRKILPTLINFYWSLQIIFVITQNIAMDVLFGWNGHVSTGVGVVVGGLIWVNYFSRSERVKATFVN